MSSTDKEKLNERRRYLYQINREKIIQQKKEWRLKNIEKERQRYLKYDSQNREKRRLSAKNRRVYKPRKRISESDKEAKRLDTYRKYYEKNREKILQKNAEYRKKNSGLINARNSKRRCIEIQATPKWLTKQHLDEIKRIYIEAKNLQKIDSIIRHVDHIVPLKGKNVCGLHVPWNLQILSKDDNLKKKNKVL